MPEYFKYWGKAKAEDGSDPAFHLLPYHRLDVAAVGREWWQQSKVIREYFALASGLSEEKAFAWMMFFIVLHDLGKFDVRFQLKAQDVALCLWSEFANADESESRHYYHGNYSSYWLFKDLDVRFNWGDPDFGDVEKWDVWQPWIFAVAGHHGVVPEYVDGVSPKADPHVLEHDQSARLAFINEMETLFLKPVGLSLDDTPPPVDQDFLAGFCSVCDWLGSMEANGFGETRFHYVNQVLMQSFLQPIAHSAYARVLATKLFPANFQVGQHLAFQLLANPTKCISDIQNKSNKKNQGKCRAPLIKEDEQRDWLQRKLTGAVNIGELTIRNHAPLYFRKGSRAGKIVPVLFEGTITISDVEKANDLWRNGVGPAKAFGCGLLLVRRA